MRIDPINDNVILKQDESEKISSGGIVIPDTAGHKPLQGIVLAVGNGKFKDGMFVKTTVKPGQRVLYRKFTGNDFELDGEKLIGLPEDAIIGVIKE